jgi:tetratricopeptide (TPR) repeat protein
MTADARATQCAQLRERGDQLFNEAKYSAAEICYREAIAAAPQDSKAHSDLGFSLRAQGRAAEASDAAKLALQIEAGNADAHFLLASLAQSRGELNDAETHFRQSLKYAPDFESCYLEFCRFLLQQGRADDAFELLNQGIESNPARVNLHYYLGNLAFEKKQLDAAVASFEAALALDPSNSAVLSNLGVVYLQQGKFEQAADAFQGALHFAPGVADLHNNLGEAQQNLGNYPAAIACFEQAAALAPNMIEAHLNLGTALRLCLEFERAIDSFGHAVKIDPQHVGAQFQLGEALQAAQRLEEAADCYRFVLEHDPDHVDTLLNLGGVHQQQKEYSLASVEYQKVLQLQPGHVGALFNLATLQHSEAYYGDPEKRDERFAKAIEQYRAVLAIDPHHIQSHLWIAAARLAQMRLDEALASYDDALAIDPENPDVRARRGSLLLLMGDFASGWADSEYRFQETNGVPFPKFSCPLWRNDAPLEGKRILICTEQGLGDSLHFVRYIELVAQLSPDALYFAVPIELRPLFESLHGITRLLSTGDIYPEFDYYCPLMSLPYAFKTELDTIPAKVPYLHAPSALAAHWAEKLKEFHSPRIGIAWSGNPKYVSDFNRTIDFKALRPYLDATNLHFFSLQKNVRAEDVELLSNAGNITDLAPHLNNFADTAAIVANLDLIISADTSVAHLAGALGRPVWIMIPYTPDSRWLTNRTDSPWYPTARLFRQSRPRDWISVFKELQAALESLDQA